MRRGSALLLFLLLACRERPRQASENRPQLSGSGQIAVVNLRGAIPEGRLGDGIFPRPVSQTYVGLVRRLEKLAADKKVSGLFVKLGPGVGFHRAEELGELIRLQAKRFPIYCHAHELDNSTAWLALRACDRIWVSAAGDVSTVGVAAELAYIKGTFDKLGIEADMLAMGKYKSGGESLTRTDPSPDSRENLQQTLAHLRKVWLDGLSRGRDNADQLKLLVEDGPWTPEVAKARGLVSDVGFEDQALDALKDKAMTRKVVDIFGPEASDRSDSGVAEIVRLLAGAQERTGGRKHIALVPAVGSITVGGGGMLGGESGIAAATMTRTIRRLRQDEAVRAIVVRLDSPGGSPLASDLIWRELMLTREEKPVIISIGSMAASGGYYIASAGSKIVSAESAIVGSIGVFGGKIVLGGALEKIGVTHHAVAASPRPGAEDRALHLSPLRRWDDATRERVRESMRRIYDLFIARVAEGRGLASEAVYETAEGAIFLAQTAKERGLIDETGGLLRAIEIARAEAHLPSDAPVVVEGASETLLETLLLGPEPDAGEVEAAIVAYQRRVASAALPFGELQATASLRPFAAMVLPLLQGETVVAALPLSLQVH